MELVAREFVVARAAVSEVKEQRLLQCSCIGAWLDTGPRLVADVILGHTATVVVGVVVCTVRKG